MENENYRRFREKKFYRKGPAKAIRKGFGSKCPKQKQHVDAHAVSVYR